MQERVSNGGGAVRDEEGRCGTRDRGEVKKMKRIGSGRWGWFD